MRTCLCRFVHIFREARAMGISARDAWVIAWVHSNR